MSLQTLKLDWFSNVRNDVLAGLVVALALIPEAIAFSIIAGVDPKVGLYASFSIATIIAFAGGRPGMISAATGAMALLMVTLVKEHGLQYLLAATLLTGLFQIAAGYLRLGSLMRFVSRSVVTGFVNALAILIFMAQLPELTNVTWQVYAMTAAGLGIIYLFPLVPVVGKLLPSPLLCIVILTAVAITLGIDIRTVGDMGELPDTLPIFLWPEVPLNLETLAIIAWIGWTLHMGLAFRCDERVFRQRQPSALQVLLQTRLRILDRLPGNDGVQLAAVQAGDDHARNLMSGIEPDRAEYCFERVGENRRTLCAAALQFAITESQTIAER
mgnify:CR=1 FL=1